MAGAILAVGVLACTAGLVLGMTTVGAAAVFGQKLSGAADAAALAAADAASGALPGDPCRRAAEIAAATGAMLVGCELVGLVATVEVSANFGALPASARARAGPPP